MPQVSRSYHEVPYHNFHHCADVVHTVYCFLNRVDGAVALTRLEKLALIVASLCHDMDHPGARPLHDLYMPPAARCRHLLPFAEAAAAR